MFTTRRSHNQGDKTEMSFALTYRAIVSRVTAQSVLVALLLTTLLAPSAVALDIRIGFLGPTESDAWYGASQGISEANQQGKFLGLLYTLAATPDQSQALAADTAVLITAVSASRLLNVAAAAGPRAVVNVSAAENELREACVANLFHTLPSFAMRSDAIQQWQRKESNANVEARAWHPDFKKYAAGQLNKRYAAASGRTMTDSAWAAWAAVKLVSDTVARLGNNDPDSIVQALTHELAFDGQKGVDMNFRNTGQLRQPMLLIQNDAVVGEAPVRGIVATGNLDSLGLADCRK
jgi:ABC-type branched-subunit amino acid transport system substrate-binding protein